MFDRCIHCWKPKKANESPYGSECAKKIDKEGFKIAVLRDEDRCHHILSELDGLSEEEKNRFKREKNAYDRIIRIFKRHYGNPDGTIGVNDFYPFINDYSDLFITDNIKSFALDQNPEFAQAMDSIPEKNIISMLEASSRNLKNLLHLYEGKKIDELPQSLKDWILNHLSEREIQPEVFHILAEMFGKEHFLEILRENKDEKNIYVGGFADDSCDLEALVSKHGNGFSSTFSMFITKERADQVLYSQAKSSNSSLLTAFPQASAEARLEVLKYNKPYGSELNSVMFMLLDKDKQKALLGDGKKKTLDWDYYNLLPYEDRGVLVDLYVDDKNLSSKFQMSYAEKERRGLLKTVNPKKIVDTTFKNYEYSVKRFRKTPSIEYIGKRIESSAEDLKYVSEKTDLDISLIVNEIKNNKIRDVEKTIGVISSSDRSSYDDDLGVKARKRALLNALMDQIKKHENYSEYKDTIEELENDPSSLIYDEAKSILRFFDSEN